MLNQLQVNLPAVNDLYIHLSIYPSIYLSIHLSIYLSIYLPIHSSIPLPESKQFQDLPYNSYLESVSLERRLPDE